MKLMKPLMLTLAVASVAGAAFAADGESKMRDAAQSAGKAASEENAAMQAGAMVNSEEVKANAEAAAAVSASSVTGTVKHRAKQAMHEVKKGGHKVSEKYHKEMAGHYENKAAADVSATLNTGK